METGSAPSTPPTDPVIDAYKASIDRTLIRHNLTLTIEQRIDALQSLMQSIDEMQQMGRRAREAVEQREPR
jgi:hypothetical protein